MSTLVQRLYKGRDNVTNLKFSVINDLGNEVDIDLTPVVNCEIIFHGGKGDSDAYARTSQGVDMSWDSTGNFYAYLGDIDIDEGEYFATLIFFDAGHPDGQVFIHRDSHRKLRFKVVS